MRPLTEEETKAVFESELISVIPAQINELNFGGPMTTELANYIVRSADDQFSTSSAETNHFDCLALRERIWYT